MLKSNVQNLGKADTLAAPVSSVGVRTKEERDVIVLLGGIQVENYLFGTEKERRTSVKACNHTSKDSSPERTGRNTLLRVQ